MIKYTLRINDKEFGDGVLIVMSRVKAYVGKGRTLRYVQFCAITARL